VTGDPVPLANDVALSGAGVAQFALATNGTLVYAPSPARSLVTVDRKGVAKPVTEEQANFHSPRFSPDGSRIAVDFTSQDGRDVWMLDRRQKTMSRVTFDHDGHDPVWSPDGQSIMYLSGKSGTTGVYSVRPGTVTSDSVYALSPLTYSAGRIRATGELVATMTELSAGSGLDLVRIKPGSAAFEPINASKFNEGWPTISPDGRWLAFASDQSGRFEIYVRSLVDPAAAQVQVSGDGGSEPMWSKAGDELYYRQPKSGVVDLVGAKVSNVGGFHVISRDVLFQATEYDATQPHANYDVSPDGREFVMARRNPATHFVVMQNVGAIIRRLQRRGGER